MRIVHACLSNYYVDGMGYQENMLVRQHVDDGHDVTVVASTEVLDERNRIQYLAPGEYDGDDGARVVRLPYARLLPHRLARKVRRCQGFTTALQEMAPDVILFHGMAAWDLLSAARFARRNGATLYADTHSDFANSARGVLSRAALHGIFYRSVVQQALPSIEMCLCVSLSTMDFARQVYGVPDKKLEFYPIGGVVPDDRDYASKRRQIRQQLGVQTDDTVSLISGKFGRHKRLLETLTAFAKVDDPDQKLLVCGALSDDIATDARALMDADPRVFFKGWIRADELVDYLCAADLYIQPGSQSATMQQAICCRCAVVLDDVASHKPYVKGNGWLVDGGSDFSFVFWEIRRSGDTIVEMSMRSEEIAREMLDYKLLAQRIRPAG